MPPHVAVARHFPLLSFAFFFILFWLEGRNCDAKTMMMMKLPPQSPRNEGHQHMDAG